MEVEEEDVHLARVYHAMVKQEQKVVVYDTLLFRWVASK
jgi:hypothetical protein